MIHFGERQDWLLVRWSDRRQGQVWSHFLGKGSLSPKERNKKYIGSDSNTLDVAYKVEVPRKTAKEEGERQRNREGAQWLQFLDESGESDQWNYFRIQKNEPMIDITISTA